ncbi:MAG: nucleotide pyrophosphohydrolase [Candidatus Muproteobacteria bacterium RBG_16_60_9]|uniref:Nucleotide pyrophosphohydrolase n=1 Tax=Candidatus Muproteobacteria bacterium RBG_16_60_9 TaxID=1817755 RepID=A0A1F6VAY4_9PROT|nr:MAG: nucleotide pyrophosphohydrolase [Candidatus Muproteobacteria bacterium RBG_16_60_9]
MRNIPLDGLTQTVTELSVLRDRLRRFAAERDWDQYHSPKNLAMALIAEAAELVEHFQWLSESQSAALSPETRKEVEAEIADVLIYLVRLADKLDIDLARAAISKMALNEVRYPVDQVRGSAKKYTEY